MIPLRLSKLRTARLLALQLLYRKKTNSPYLSCDSFASLADYIPFGVDGKESFNHDRANASRIVFIQADKIEVLSDSSLSKSLNPRVVITGNSDRNFREARPNPFGAELWLCQNNAMPPRPGLLTMPIGLENLRIGRSGRKRWFRRLAEPVSVDRILVPPMSPTNSIRTEVIRKAMKIGAPFVVQTRYMTEKQYFELTKGFQFILCLEGNGFENHRIWEALYLGVFPIVFNTPWSRSLKWMNLPIMFIDSLEEINEDSLNAFYRENQDFDPKDHNLLWVDGWRDIINAHL